MDWEWEDGLPGSCKWQPYAPDQISALNRACAKQSTLNLPIWHTGLPGSSRAYYTFDFDNLTQKRDTTNCVRAVRCNSPALKAQMVAASAERAASKRQQEEAAAYKQNIEYLLQQAHAHNNRSILQKMKDFVLMRRAKEESEEELSGALHTVAYSPRRTLRPLPSLGA